MCVKLACEISISIFIKMISDKFILFSSFLRLEFRTYQKNDF
jgi:hypothetical protein